MVTRRLTQVSTSDDDGAPKPSSSDDDTNHRRRRHRSRRREEDRHPHRRRKKLLRLSDYLDDDDDEEERFEDEEDEEEDEDEEVPVQEDAKPVGEVISVSGKGKGLKKHYKEFDFDGYRFELEDPVLLTPEDKKQKPYVAIIKEITQTRDGSIMVTGQWFYRPEEAERKGGGSWQARDSRELFYSFHRDEVPAESVMHKCKVHFVPLNKQLPNRKEHPGFFVQKVYDTVEKKLWKLTDKDYEDGKQEEIDVLVQKTISRLGELRDVETDDMPAQLEEQARNKRMLRKRHVSPLDVSREDEGTPRSDQTPRGETPGSCIDKASPHYIILAEAKALTKDTHRDRWLEKLLRTVEYVCTPTENRGGKVPDVAKSIGQPNGDKGSQEESTKGQSNLTWPDSAVSAVTALEKASYETLPDNSKYNQKLRQLDYNLKGTELLARRLLNGELEPSKILTMSPKELKEGLTEEEIARNQPEESASMQMTDARCKRCNEKKVGLVDIIQAGHGDRYQLECIACGNTWYAFRDEVATLTIDGPNSINNVGTAPWATSKFETVEKKKAVSPRDNDKGDEVKKVVSPRDTDKAGLLTKAVSPRDTDKAGLLTKAVGPRDTDKAAAVKKVVSPRESDKAGSVKTFESHKSFNKSRTDDATAS